MSWLGFLQKLLDIFPFLEKWIDLQEKKLPMKIEVFEEKKEIRLEDNKQELIKEEIQTSKKELKKLKKLDKIEDKKQKHIDKRNKRNEK